MAGLWWTGGAARAAGCRAGLGASAGRHRAFSIRLRQQVEMGALTLIGCGSAFALYGVCVLVCAACVLCRMCLVSYRIACHLRCM
jgi:hypothetical protein